MRQFLRNKLGVFGFGLLCLCGTASQVQAAPIFAPTDGPSVIGGASDGTNFNRAIAGTVAGVNNFPAAESPDHVLDGVGQKYLNFAKTNTGFIVTPGVGSSKAGVIKFWAANDAPERDPSSFQLFGSNSAIPAGSVPLSNFTLITSGALALPASRNAGGGLPGGLLLDANSQEISFANNTSYTSYMVLFPDVKTNASANSMQIAEVLLSTAVPEPGSLALIALGGLVLARRRR